MTTDYLVKALAFEGQIRAYAVRSTETVGEVQERHQMWPTATAALGRTISASVMMGAMLKGEDSITVKIQGNGPLGPIVVDANAKGEVRGYATNPQTHLPLNEQGKLDVRGAVGTEGMLSIVKDLGMKDYFTGQVPIISGEIAEDFTQYMVVSEQVPSAVALGVLVDPDNTVKASGGFILQVMPGATEETIELLEGRIANMTAISTMIDNGLTPEGILVEVLGQENVEFLSRIDVKFDCECSKERFSEAIKGLGAVEIQAMIDEDHGAEAQCHFCLEKYQFSEQELRELI
ncbi:MULTISPECIES: Hsp33 family molecular chaperone HslO [unclassified Sporosarcina]|uniref:Hsp33 family molecular chaperone HslO n=1 Tax=unclassified Sporosarcina TaxID=2647733 RepID=UPI000C16B13A|nr:MULTISPECIES: Hsp33 family molecular chaperone HslO [unclassified Sporosarcina]PIC84971.1 Hsp33 family molecular chaperone HslO [Sporosarcina sp. P20a]PIC98622.1 Hsp33 family molecular chaperone HslO [Sporosarcina sp. P29]PID05112.1 Hsp33 family molecular chaperone HslO [Sporosarcina sp. P30]PID08310.1 Hsp33 family molecular chaperone HslO [Sporosarcina sp. P31]PID11389.1 Hsp33 family molecular chaperone HslO [Sporosarcina sp. P32b]